MCFHPNLKGTCCPLTFYCPDCKKIIDANFEIIVALNKYNPCEEFKFCESQKCHDEGYFRQHPRKPSDTPTQ